MAQKFTGDGEGGFSSPPVDAWGEGRAAPSGRVLPQDLEAEKAVLSGLLLDNDAIHTVLTEVKPGDFYHPAHQQLYQAMLTLQDENEPVDLHTLSDYLNSRKLLDAIGGPIFLAEIADYEATAANVVQHARIVRDKAVKRRPGRRRVRAASTIVRPEPIRRMLRAAPTAAVSIRHGFST